MRKSDRIPVGPQYDRRRKLSDAQKAEILRIYQTGVCGMRPLAKQFGVSRSPIQLIVNPERAAQVKQRTKEHWRDYRPSKKEWAAIMREHRDSKMLIL